MAPKRVARQAKAKAKREAQERLRVRLDYKTKRMLNRRRAVQGMNVLLSGLSLSELALNPKDTDMNGLGRALRVLEKRCTARGALRSAVQAWVSNGGKLPAGIRLTDANDVQVVSDDAETAPLVGGHKVLITTFELKSQAFMLTYNSRHFTPDKWLAFRDHMKELHTRRGSKAWSACMETSPHTAHSSGEEVQPRYHTHGYLLWTDGIGYRSDTLNDLTFEGVRPRVDKCVQGSNTKAPRRAALHGLWYVYVKKAGTLYSDSNWIPWTADYSPSSWWLVSLWEQHKLSHAQYLDLSVQFRTGHASRRKEVLQVIADENAAAVRDHVTAEEKVLNDRQPLQPFCHFPELDAFVELFSESMRRRPILLIIGGTNSGKSLLAKEVLRRVGEKLQLPGFVEITVEGADFLDLSTFVVNQHAGILLDGVGDALLFHTNREVLQGRPKECAGGQSRTMMYAYTYTLARRAVVATMDLSAKRLHMLKTDHWLAASQNVLQLWLDRPAWQNSTPLSSPSVSLSLPAAPH